MRLIREQHAIERGVVAEVLKDSTFVPAGRLEFFGRGIAAGLEGNFLVALHLLVPQIEHALRCILQQQGVITSSIDAAGVEEDWPMPTTLRHPALAAVLGESFVYELTGLLVQKTGPNLRNLLSHGVLPPGAFRNGPAIYIWWLVLRICIQSHPGIGAYVERRRIDK